MSWQPCPDPVPGDPHACDLIDTVVPPRMRDLGGFKVGCVLPTPQQGMDIRPHPHINLATVTYLFDGEITHRDSLGTQQVMQTHRLGIKMPRRWPDIQSSCCCGHRDNALRSDTKASLVQAGRWRKEPMRGGSGTARVIDTFDSTAIGGPPTSVPTERNFSVSVAEPATNCIVVEYQPVKPPLRLLRGSVFWDSLKEYRDVRRPPSDDAK